MVVAQDGGLFICREEGEGSCGLGLELARCDTESRGLTWVVRSDVLTAWGHRGRVSMIHFVVAMMLVLELSW